MNVLMVISYLANIAVFIFAFTRPSSTWLSADRNRTYWLMLIGIIGLLGVLGLIADAAFLIGVLPRMLSNAKPEAPQLSRPDPNVRPNPFTKP